MTEIPVISSRVLHGMPHFVRQEMGERALRQANRAAGFDLELLEGQNCFIPHTSVVSFLNAAAKVAGEPNLGTLILPAMNAANYGSYGHYVLGAETLVLAIKRAIAALPYHSTGDRMSASVIGNEVIFSYAFALSGCAGYDVIAIAAAGVLLSVLKAYLPLDWRPLRVELDIARPWQVAAFETAFQCPVIFGAPTVTVVIERHHLAAAARRDTRPIVTIEDVMRARTGRRTARPAQRGYRTDPHTGPHRQGFTGQHGARDGDQHPDTATRTEPNLYRFSQHGECD